MDPNRVVVRLAQAQLDDIVDALIAYADDCAEDAEILNSMSRVDTDTVNDLMQRQHALLRLAAWLQHVQEENA